MNQLVNDDDLSDELLNTMRVSLVFPVNITATIIGLLANIVNMVVLTTLGIANSMSVGVLALSFTDLLVSFLQLVIYVLYVLDKAYPSQEVDLAALGSFGVGWIRYASFFISSWITTLISMEKCVCVVLPFMVKRIFTKSRSLIAVVFIYAIHIALIAPIYFVQELRWTVLPQSVNNETGVGRRIFTFVYSEDFVNVETVVNNIYAVGLAVTSQVILLVCTLWMIYSLKSSSRIRQSSNHEMIFFSNSKIENVYSPQVSSLSVRERKLVKVALGLGIVLTASNIPRYAVVATYYGIPGMSQGAYKNLSDFLWDITDFFSIINCSSNFLVYWILNSNFRKSFNNIFCGH